MSAVIDRLLEARAQINAALRAAGFRHRPAHKTPLHTLVFNARKAHRLTLQEVADMVGITKSHMWELERGTAVNPTVRTVIGLADALSIDHAEIIDACFVSDVRKP